MPNEIQVKDVQRIVERAFFFPERLALLNWLVTLVPAHARGNIEIPGLVDPANLAKLRETSEYFSSTGDVLLVFGTLSAVSTLLDDITAALGTESLAGISDEVGEGLNQLDALSESAPALFRPILDAGLVVPRFWMSLLRDLVRPLVLLEEASVIADTAIQDLNREVENIEAWSSVLE